MPCSTLCSGMLCCGDARACVQAKHAAEMRAAMDEKAAAAVRAAEELSALRSDLQLQVSGLQQEAEAARAAEQKAAAAREAMAEERRTAEERAEELRERVAVLLEQQVGWVGRFGGEGRGCGVVGFMAGAGRCWPEWGVVGRGSLEEKGGGALTAGRSSLGRSSSSRAWVFPAACPPGGGRCGAGQAPRLLPPQPHCAAPPSPRPHPTSPLTQSEQPRLASLWLLRAL